MKKKPVNWSAHARRLRMRLHKESKKGFVTAPTIKQLQPTAREKHLLAVLWNWEHSYDPSRMWP